MRSVKRSSFPTRRFINLDEERSHLSKYGKDPFSHDQAQTSHAGNDWYVNNRHRWVFISNPFNVSYSYCRTHPISPFTGRFFMQPLWKVEECPCSSPSFSCSCLCFLKPWLSVSCLGQGLPAKVP